MCDPVEPAARGTSSWSPRKGVFAEENRGFFPGRSFAAGF